MLISELSELVPWTYGKQACVVQDDDSGEEDVEGGNALQPQASSEDIQSPQCTTGNHSGVQASTEPSNLTSQTSQNDTQSSQSQSAEIYR